MPVLLQKEETLTAQNIKSYLQPKSSRSTILWFRLRAEIYAEWQNWSEQQGLQRKLKQIF